MNPDILRATNPERLLALASVLALAVLTFFLAKALGKRLKGITRLGLHRLDRLAAPLTLLAIAGAAAALMLPLAVEPDVMGFGIEVLLVVAVYWLLSRALDVFWATGEQSVRLRHSPVARGALLSARQFGKVAIWIGALATLAVKFGAAKQLYLVLGAIGAALAFAARDPIRNAIAFASMVLDPPFRLGDRVRIEAFRGGPAAEGRVIALTLSSVTVETDRHTRVVVSNVKIQDLRVENLSVADRRRLEFVVPVPRELPTEALREACNQIEKDLTEDERVSKVRPPHVWISGAPGGLNLKASLWLRKASRRRQTQRDLLLKIRERLEARARAERHEREERHGVAPRLVHA